MIRLITLWVVGLLCSACVSVDVVADDSRHYMLTNRLNKIESDLVELKRLRARVSQLEVVKTQHERRMQDEFLRMGELEERNESLEAFVNTICKQLENEQSKIVCGNAGRN